MLKRAVLLLFLLFVCPAQGALQTPGAVAYFSPDDCLGERLVEMINSESESVYVCIYTFTHRDVIAALVAAKKRGVDVEVIVDRFSVKTKAPLYKLTDVSIPVFVWAPDQVRRAKGRRPIMHNKFCVFGNEVVWTGSFNFTYEASRLHQENALVISNEALARAYKNQFHTIKTRNCVPLGSFIAAHPKKKSVKERG
jgi:phosphatidylserine/phosphatidylglycerophosphate/cardiolipin synthase-like enzyme